jgi:hypothetical protein
MPHVVFVAPRFLETTNRYVAAFAKLDEVTLSVISEDPQSSIPKVLRPRIAGHYRVRNSLDPAQLEVALRGLTKGIGPVDRLAGALEQLQMPMAEVRDALDIEGLRVETARRFRDKDRMKEVLRAHGVPVAKSRLIGSKEALSRYVDEIGFPVIVKPRAGFGTRATFRLTNREELAEHLRRGTVVSPENPLQVEEMVRAREHTCETVTVRGKTVWRSGTRYFPSPLEVLETPWTQYCVLLPREDEDTEWTRFEKTNEAALAALFGPWAGTAAGTALTHMEWFLKDDGSALVNEVGARPPGVLIMPLMGLAHETDFFDDWAELVSLDRFTPKKRRWAAGGAFFRGQGGGRRVVEVSGVQKAIEEAGPALVELRAPKVGMARADGYEGEGWATVRSDTTEGAKRALRALIENIQVRYG